MLKIESPSASRQYSSTRPVEWISSVNQKTKLSGDHLVWHKFVPSFLAHDIFSVTLGVGCYNMPSKSVDDDNWCTWEDVTTKTVCISRSEGLVTRNFATLKCGRHKPSRSSCRFLELRPFFRRVK